MVGHRDHPSPCIYPGQFPYHHQLVPFLSKKKEQPVQAEEDLKTVMAGNVPKRIFTIPMNLP